MAHETGAQDYQKAWGAYLGALSLDIFLNDRGDGDGDGGGDGDGDEYVIDDDFSFSEDDMDELYDTCSSSSLSKKPSMPVKALSSYLVEYYRRLSPDDYSVHQVQVFPFSDGSTHTVDLGVVTKKACRVVKSNLKTKYQQ